MIAPDEPTSTHTQPQGSGWYISASSSDDARTVEVNGVAIVAGPKTIPEKVINTLMRWMFTEYEKGISPEKLAQKVALAHGGMMCKAPRITLSLHDTTQFPALGERASSESRADNKDPPPKYWFAFKRKPRIKKQRRGTASKRLPPEYVQGFSDYSRGPDNNPNIKYLAGYSAADLGVPENELEDFMQSGLGPKEYNACNKVARHLKSRIDMARDRLEGDDFARETRDTAIDAALTTLFSTQVGLPVGFGDRLWHDFAKHMWKDTDIDPEDVVSDCLSRGILGDSVGAAALNLMLRVNPDLYWNYSGKSNPAKAARNAERAVYEFASDLLSKLRESPGSTDEASFNRLKYPDSDTSSSDVSDEEARREIEDCHHRAVLQDAQQSNKSALSAETIPGELPKLEELYDGYLAGMSDSSDSEPEDSQNASASFKSSSSFEPPGFDVSDGSSESDNVGHTRHVKRVKAKKKMSPSRERIDSKRQRGETKKVRAGKAVEKAIAVEKQQAAGERDGVIEHLKAQIEDLQMEREENYSCCGFDPEKTLYFHNDHGTVIMRPTREGISVLDAYRKGAHLFGWVAEVASTEVTGQCFISVDKLMHLKNRYWSRATEICKSSLLTSLVGEKWPYMAEYYLCPTDVERKAFDIIFNSSPDPEYRMMPTIMKSAYPKTESEILNRLRVSDPNYLKDRRAYQLLPLDDTYMAYHFPICTDELEKMMCKRLTSKFNQANWRIPGIDSPWFKLYGNNTWDIDFDQQSNFGFFRDYAEKIIQVKSTLSRAERAQWRDMADRIDKMGPKEIVKKLRASMRAETNCFIKNELYAKDSTTLRLIISPSLFVKIVFGAVIKRIEEKLYSGDVSIPITGHHIKHIPLSHAEALFSSWQSRGDGQFYETDYSAYESSQNETSLRTEFELYKSYYKQNSLATEILDTVLEQMLSGTVVVRNKYFSIRMPVMRWSGMPNTACGNLLMNYYNLVVNCGLNPESDFLLEGDDGLIWGDCNLGNDLETKSAFPLTMQTACDYTRLSFCGLHYEGDAHIPADENLAIAKLLTYFDSQELSLQKRYELLYLRLISYQLLYPKWPTLNSIIQQAEKYYHNSAYRQITESTIRRWFNEQGWWMNQMLGDFDISDMVLPGGSYAFVHLCYENIDSVKRRTRNMVLSRSEREMGKLLPEFQQSTGSRILRQIGNVVATAGPAVGVALAMSGRRKQALATVVASAAVSTVINEFVPPEGSDAQSHNKSTNSFLDKIWVAAGQVLPALFTFKSSDLSLDRSKISKPQASVIACENGPASLSH